MHINNIALIFPFKLFTLESNITLFILDPITYHSAFPHSIYSINCWPDALPNEKICQMYKDRSGIRKYKKLQKHITQNGNGFEGQAQDWELSCSGSVSYVNLEG
jgi:hypothetical protein